MWTPKILNLKYILNIENSYYFLIFNNLSIYTSMFNTIELLVINFTRILINAHTFSINWTSDEMSEQNYLKVILSINNSMHYL